MEFSNINLVSALVATVAGFLLGWIWYSPLFGKKWQSENGFTDEYLKEGNMGKIFGLGFLLTFVMAISMAMIIQGHDNPDIGWQSGLTHGLYAGVGFMATALGLAYVYMRKSLTVYLIDAGYQILLLAVMGAILGAWA
jgi:hypothetical protein